MKNKKSIKKKKNYSVIFMYSTKHLKNKDKVRFYYALKGRDGKSGIVKEWNIQQLGRTVLLVKNIFESELNQFLIHWKCEFSKKRILILDE